MILEEVSEGLGRISRRMERVHHDWILFGCGDRRQAYWHMWDAGCEDSL